MKRRGFGYNSRLQNVTHKQQDTTAVRRCRIETDTRYPVATADGSKNTHRQAEPRLLRVKGFRRLPGCKTLTGKTKVP